MKIFLAVLLTIIMLNACTKSSTPSVQGRLVGKWAYSLSVTDSNKNGIMDPGEIAKPNIRLDTSAYPSPFPYMPLIILNSNGNGSTLSNVNDTANFNIRWLLYYNNTSIEGIYSSQRGDTSKWVMTWFYQIDSLSSTSLVFKDTVGYGATHIIHWFIYIKQ